MLSQPASLARFVPAVLAALMLGACAGNAPRNAPPPASAPGHEPAPVRKTPQSVGERAAVIAVRQVGVPYRYGGTGNGGFDCSGLVHFAYAKAGKKIPRTTATLWEASQAVQQRELKVGDLVFFRIAGKMSHVGLYIGKRRFVHAPSSGREVTIAELDSDFYRQAFLRGGRLR